MADDDMSLWEIILREIARFGLCQSCYFAPAADAMSTGEAWTCPRCGFRSTGDVEMWGPATRNFDPVGADEPAHDGSPEPDAEDDDNDDLWFEPEFPILDQINEINQITRVRQVGASALPRLRLRPHFGGAASAE